MTLESNLEHMVRIILEGATSSEWQPSRWKLWRVDPAFPVSSCSYLLACRGFARVVSRLGAVVAPTVFCGPCGDGGNSQSCRGVPNSRRRLDLKDQLGPDQPLLPFGNTERLICAALFDNQHREEREEGERQ
jgi:hypothetical protein